jgi:hypothetical protein
VKIQKLVYVWEKTGEVMFQRGEVKDDPGKPEF